MRSGQNKITLDIKKNESFNKFSTANAHNNEQKTFVLTRWVVQRKERGTQLTHINTIQHNIIGSYNSYIWWLNSIRTQLTIDSVYKRISKHFLDHVTV